MACYRQIKQEWEQGTGIVTAELVISDDYANLFTQTGVEDVDIFKFNSVKKDLEKNGSQKEDEFNFEMSGAKIKTPAEQDAYDLVLTAQTTNIFIALFLYESDPYTSGVVSDLNFSGIIRNKIAASNLFSSGSQWGSTPAPVRNWKISAASFGTAILNEINTSDKTVDSETIPGILDLLAADGTWIAANVSDALWLTDYNEYFKNMVSLNAGLEKLRVLAEARVQETIPGFTLTFKASQSGFRFIPAIPDLTTNGFFGGWKSWDALWYRLHLLNTTDQYQQPKVNFNLFVPGYGNPNDDLEKQYASVEKEYSFKRYETFSELLYAIAPCFGCYCVMRNISGTEIEIEFVPIESAVQADVYLCDFVSGELDIQTETSDEKLFKGRANHAAVEGVDDYSVKDFNYNQFGIIEPSKKFIDGQKEKGDLLPLSVSPSLITAKWLDGYSFRPHNHYNSSLFYNGPFFLHTAIYFNIEYPGSLDVCLPAIKVGVKIDGEISIYNNLAGCLNAIKATNGLIHKTEYKRVIPWLSRFSLSSDGSSQSWKNIVLGSKYTEDTIEYLVAGLELNIDKFETSLRLTKLSKYAYTEPETTGTEITGSPIPQLMPGIKKKTAGESLSIGYAAILSLDDQAFKMQALANNYGKFAGIVLNECTEGGDVYLQDSGEFQCLDFDFTPGLLVYLRDNAGINLSHDALLDPTDTEDLSLCLGIAKTANMIELKRMFESIAFPKIGAEL